MRITLTPMGKLEDACQQLRPALREKPAYLSARQALAQSLLLQHQFEPATQEL
jgi:hypothetical protein